MRAALQYVTGHGKDGRLPDDLDWKSLADPAATTAIYMPTGTLVALIARATAEGLDPRTPALAIARATRPDQAVVAAPIGELANELAKADLRGPLLVMVGRDYRRCGLRAGCAGRGVSMADRSAARQHHGFEFR